MPSDQSCLHAKCGPSEPCLGSHVSLGHGIWPFWGGAGGHFVSWGPVLSVRNPTNKKPVLAITRRHRGVFGNVLAHRNRVRVAQLSYSDDVGGFHPSFLRNRDLLVFGGVSALREIPGPNRQKNFDPKKIGKKIRNFYFSLRFQEICSRQKQSDFFSSSAPAAPYKGRAH